MTSPRATTEPWLTSTVLRYDTDTLKPSTGSKVTDLIPATVPANVTSPSAGAMTSVPTGTP